MAAFSSLNIEVRGRIIALAQSRQDSATETKEPHGATLQSWNKNDPPLVWAGHTGPPNQVMLETDRL